MNMGAKLDKTQFYLYKYVVTGIFVAGTPFFAYLGYLDITSNTVSVFSTAAVIWTLITLYLVKLAYGMQLAEFTEN